MDENMSERATLTRLFKKYGAEPRKSLGQNFIIDDTVCPRIAGAVDEGCSVIEIGPGAGALTASLAQRAPKVVAVEIDSRMSALLAERFAGVDNVRIITADAMKLDLAALIAEMFSPGERISVVGNLPYYITTPLVMKFLEDRLKIESVVAMVQKEAAQRLCAAECSRECGAVTLAVRYYSEPEILFDVGRESFYPRPDVTSSVMRLAVRSSPVVVTADERLMFSLIRAAFSQRRKTACNSIANVSGIAKGLVVSAMEQAGIPPDTRAERISLAGFAALADRLTSG